MVTASWTTRLWRGVRLVTLLTLASTTVSAVSLNDLQAIPDGTLPTTCSVAYHTTILGCIIADFASGGHCSDTCKTGIKSIESTIEDDCENVVASQNSVLSFAKRGVLIIHACFGNDITLTQTTATSTSSSSLTTTSPTTTPTTTATTTRSIGSFTTIPSSTTTSIQSTESSTTTSLTIIPPNTLTTPVVLTSALSTSSQETTHTSASTSSTTSSSATPTSTQVTEGGGGGSPFDTTAGSSHLSASLLIYVPIGAALVTLLF